MLYLVLILFIRIIDTLHCRILKALFVAQNDIIFKRFISFNCHLLNIFSVESLSGECFSLNIIIHYYLNSLLFQTLLIKSL